MLAVHLSAFRTVPNVTRGRVAATNVPRVHSLYSGVIVGPPGANASSAQLLALLADEQMTEEKRWEFEISRLGYGQQMAEFKRKFGSHYRGKCEGRKCFATCHFHRQMIGASDLDSDKSTGAV